MTKFYEKTGVVSMTLGMNQENVKDKMCRFRQYVDKSPVKKKFDKTIKILPYLLGFYNSDITVCFYTIKMQHRECMSHIKSLDVLYIRNGMRLRLALSVICFRLANK